MKKNNNYAGTIIATVIIFILTAVLLAVALPAQV